MRKCLVLIVCSSRLTPQEAGGGLCPQNDATGDQKGALVLEESAPRLNFRLREGEEGVENRQGGAARQDPSPLGDDDTKKVFSRLPALVGEAGDEKAFALREKSQPPRTGKTVKNAFLPPRRRRFLTRPRPGRSRCRATCPRGRAAGAAPLGHAPAADDQSVSSHDEAEKTAGEARPARRQVALGRHQDDPVRARRVRRSKSGLRRFWRVRRSTRSASRRGTKSALLGNALGAEESWTFDTDRDLQQQHLDLRSDEARPDPCPSRSISGSISRRCWTPSR